MSISANYAKIRQEVPYEVTIVIAAKERTADEIAEVIEAGATDIGQNYVQEAIKVYNDLGDKAKKVKWHMIGYLQKNKINKALSIFDCIQTVDSYEKAQAINKRVPSSGRDKLPVFIEINIGNEDSKAGIKPAEHEPLEQYMEKLIIDVSKLEHLRVEGLMTMGPYSGDPERLRPYFARTRKIFERIKTLNIPNVDLKFLSMGMSNSYKVAIEEGSNMIRIGTAIFGDRPSMGTRSL